MPIVKVLAVEGRTAEQKRGLVKDITEALVNNFNTSPEKVSIAIGEIKKEDSAVGGTFFVTDSCFLLSCTYK